MRPMPLETSLQSPTENHAINAITGRLYVGQVVGRGIEVSNLPNSTGSRRPYSCSHQPQVLARTGPNASQSSILATATRDPHPSETQAVTDARRLAHSIATGVSPPTSAANTCVEFLATRKPRPYLAVQFGCSPYAGLGHSGL